MITSAFCAFCALPADHAIAHDRDRMVGRTPQARPSIAAKTVQSLDSH
jgi:hypothetical protein